MESSWSRSVEKRSSYELKERVRRLGRASSCNSGAGSKRRSSVEVRAASGSVGREVMAGRKGVAEGLRGDMMVELRCNQLVNAAIRDKVQVVVWNEFTELQVILH